MGIHDYETMNEIRKAVNQIDFYYTTRRRMGFKYTSCTELKANQNAEKMKGIAHFNDNIRDGLKGRYLRKGKWFCKWKETWKIVLKRHYSRY